MFAFKKVKQACKKLGLFYLALPHGEFFETEEECKENGRMYRP